jgi:hypothetical protein
MTMDTQQPPAQLTVITEQSPEIALLFEALALAQGEFGEIKKNRKVTVRTEDGGTYSFRYATLDSITAATRPALSKNGISTTSSVNGKVLTVMLVHKSGQWKASYVDIGTANGEWQAYGSALTYARRHVISAMLDVAADEDDDGNAACGNTITEREGDPMEAVWNGLEEKGITDGPKQREWIETVLGRPIPQPGAIRPEDVVVLTETLAGKRPMPSKSGEKPAESADKKSEKKPGPVKVLTDLLVKAGKDKPAKALAWMGDRLKREIKSTKDLSPTEVEQLTRDAEALASEAA